MKKTIFIIPLLALIMTSCGGSGEQNPTGPISPTQGPATSGVGPSTGGVGPTSSSSSSTSQGNQPEVVSVSLNKDFIEINLNNDDKTAVLVASVEVKNNAPKSVTYTTTNDHIAHVTNTGIVIGTGSGYATIRATSTYDATKYAECIVRVIRPQDYAFDPSTVLEAGVKRYTGSVTSGSDTIDFVFEGATFDGTRFLIEEDGEAYFYSTTPVEGINNASFSMQSDMYAAASCTSFLSYNELSLANIVGGKYSDLFAYVPSPNERISIYSQYTLSMNQTQMPELRNYRYFLIHIVAYSGPVYVSMMNVRDDCASIPEIPVGTNEGVYTANEIATIKGATANIVNPTKAGNGAYTVSASSEFGITQFLPLNGRMYFETDLLNSGFALTSSREEGDNAYYLYQKQVGDVVHSFVVQYLNYATFRMGYASYGTNMGLIVRTETWPTEFLNENLREEHSSLFPALVSDKIEAFECSVSVTPSGKNVVINAIMKDGEVFTTADLDAYMALLNPANFTDDYTYSIDGLMQLYEPTGIDTSMVNFIFIEFEKYLTPPTASEIAHFLGVDSLVSSIKVFNGGQDSYYHRTSSTSGYTYYTHCVYNTNADDVNAFKDVVLAAGFEVMSGTVYYKTTDIYGSTLYLTITDGNVPNSYFFTYSFNNAETNYDHFDSFASMVDDWYDQHYYNSYEIINSIKDNVDTLPAYTYRGNGAKDTYIILNAGEEFLDELRTAAGLTGYSYPNLHMYYFDHSTNEFIYAKVIDEGVVLTFSSHSMTELFTYEKFNLNINNWGDPTPNRDKFYLNSADNLPAQFTSNGFIGTKEEVEHLAELLRSRIVETSAFTYSRYLDAWIDKTNNYAVEIRVDNYPAITGTDLRYLAIYLETGRSFIDYQAYNDYENTSSSAFTNFFSFFPEFTFDKNDDVVVNLEGYPPYVHFEVEGQDTSYVNSLNEAGFTLAFGSHYKIIDDQLYYVCLEDRGDTIRYDFKNYGNLLNSSGVYDYRDVHYTYYNEFLDTYNFTEYFVSTSPSYVVTNANQSDNESRFELLTFESNISEVNNYRSYLLANGYEFNEDNNKYVKYLDQYHTSYQSVWIYTDNGITRIVFETVDLHYQTWTNFAASLTTYDLSVHGEQVAFPSCYMDQQVLSLQDETETSLFFRILDADGVSLSDYINAIKSHPQFASADEGDSFYRTYTFNDGSYINIQTMSDFGYSAVIIYTPLP